MRSWEGIVTHYGLRIFLPLLPKADHTLIRIMLRVDVVYGHLFNHRRLHRTPLLWIGHRRRRARRDGFHAGSELAESGVQAVLTLGLFGVEGVLVLAPRGIR